jgi:hypothetical protein
MMNTKNESSLPEKFNEDVPPILGTWNKLYLFVLFFHALLIILFYLFTKAFS